jgi:trehalose 6-phosphate phosphatase
MDEEKWKADHPCALSNFDQAMGLEERRRDTQKKKKKKKVCVFLDYDGTLSPIVNDPDKAVMSEKMRSAVNRVSKLFPTGIISGRSLEKVRGFVKLDHLFYAGSHGLDIEGPTTSDNSSSQVRRDESGSAAGISYQPIAREHIDVVRDVRELLIERTREIEGVIVEDNKFCCSVHFRQCTSKEAVARVELLVKEVAEAKGLQMKQGRKVFEVRPQIPWNKGHAVSYLLGTAFALSSENSFPLYLGDDKTDEDAFAKINELGTGCSILVSTKCKPTVASHTLTDPSQVLTFLNKLADWGEGEGEGAF